MVKADLRWRLECIGHCVRVREIGGRAVDQGKVTRGARRGGCGVDYPHGVAGDVTRLEAEPLVLEWAQGRPVHNPVDFP